MRENEASSPAASQRAAVEQACDRPRRLKRKFQRRRGNVRQRVGVDRRHWVEKHDRAPAIELFENRPERDVPRINTPIIGHQHHTVRAQNPERPLDLAQSGLDVGQRQCRKKAEPCREICFHSGAVIVAVLGQTVTLLCVAEPYPGCRDGHDRAVDAIAVHDLERDLRRPRRRRAKQPLMSYAFAKRLHVRGRKNVMVNVDRRFRHLIAPIKRKARAQSSADTRRQIVVSRRAASSSAPS